jgi:hypothetical protein
LQLVANSSRLTRYREPRGIEMVAFNHHQFSQIRGRQPYLFEDSLPAQDRAERSDRARALKFIVSKVVKLAGQLTQCSSARETR